MIQIVKINPRNPEPEKILLAAEVINAEGVIGYPTETVYGIGSSINYESAIRRIYEIKKREQQKPLSIIIGEPSKLRDLVLEVSPTAERLIQAFWPGPLTLVFAAAPSLNPLLLAGGNTVGIRVPGSKICLELLKKCNEAIVSTSANISGTPEAKTATDVLDSFAEKLDLIIDGGPSQDSIPSTVVEVIGSRPIIRRVGVISEKEIHDALEQRKI